MIHINDIRGTGCLDIRVTIIAWVDLVIASKNYFL